MIFFKCVALIFLVGCVNCEIFCQNGGDATVRCNPVGIADNRLVAKLINPAGASVKRLDLRECRLKQVTRQALTDFGPIRTLDLSRNSLAYLEEGLFTDVSKIRSVNLSRNFLTGLSPNVFKPLKELRKLDLSGNALVLQGSEADFLAGLPIKILDLSNNLVVDLEKVFSLTSLTSLTVVNNRIKLTDKPTKYEGTHLKLTHNEGVNLSSQTFNAKINLINVDLSNDKLKILPPKLFLDNVKLKILNLSGNELQSIEGLIFAANSQLEYLDLSDNKLELISPSSFSSTDKLLHLDLSGNNLSKLGLLVFQSLPNLLILDLSNNKLRALHSSLFSKNTKLNILRLDRNSLTSFERLQFNYNKDLIALTLSQNEIVDFKHNLVYNLMKLMVLDLDRNNLTKIDPDLTNLPRLTDLYVSCNAIAIFKPDFFETIESKLVVVRIHGNPLKCTCINNLIDYQRRVIPDKKNFVDGRSITCLHSTDETSDDCWSDNLDPKLYSEWLLTFNNATSICKRD